MQHVLRRFCGGLQGAEAIPQAVLTPRLSACLHTLFMCLLFSLSSCCLPREPAALARGTCQACVYRTRSRYHGARQLPPPVELVVECAESSFHPAVLRAGDCSVALCSLVGFKRKRRRQDFLWGRRRESRLVPCTESHSGKGEPAAWRGPLPRVQPPWTPHHQEPSRSCFAPGPTSAGCRCPRS